VDPAPVAIVRLADASDVAVPPAVPAGALTVVVADEPALAADAADRLGPCCRAVFVGSRRSAALAEFVTEQFRGARSADLFWP
jgi:hypothetical protein